MLNSRSTTIPQPAAPGSRHERSFRTFPASGVRISRHIGRRTGRGSRRVGRSGEQPEGPLRQGRRRHDGREHPEVVRQAGHDRPGAVEALWTAVVKYRHQAPPPDEFLAGDWEAHDPVKIFNVYGYCMCCCCSSLIEALNRLDGREARGPHPQRPQRRRGQVRRRLAHVRRLAHHLLPRGRATAWSPRSTRSPRPSPTGMRPHPGTRATGQARRLMRERRLDRLEEPGARSCSPPAPSTGSASSRPGPTAGTTPWPSTTASRRGLRIRLPGRPSALFSLRPGRVAGPRGRQPRAARQRGQSPGWDGLKARAPENDLAYVKEFLPGYHGGVVGNGVHRYAPDLAAGGLAGGAEVYENLAEGGSPALRPKDGGKPGVAVIPMTSPYVYLGGKLRSRRCDARPTTGCPSRSPPTTAGPSRRSGPPTSRAPPRPSSTSRARSSAAMPTG